jgi:rare lipoprotein A
MSRVLFVFLVVSLFGGCASAPPQPATEPPPQPATEPPQPPPARGGYYKDDGPGADPPPNLAELPDAEPRAEPLHRWANRPYNVFGVDYVPMTRLEPFREQGMASWYGRRFHGQKTATGEVYDMYAMTAAHPTLPLPSYVRVTHLGNGRSVVVRVNDRGPFRSGRIIDLSYAAAHRLGFVTAGSAQVQIETIVPASEATQTVYLQIGAFGSLENAESLRARVARELGWLQETAQVMLAGSLWRLHIGPYRSAEHARSVAERIEAHLAIRPLVVFR